MSTALVKYSLDETKTVGAILAKSGFFKDSAGEAQAVAKILAGQELGFGPMAAMTGIYIVDGRVTLSANLMAAAVKRSGKYNYRVIKHNDDECEVAFFEKNDAGAWEEVGRSGLTMKEAATKQLDMAWDKEKSTWKKKPTWQKFPANMLFARAMSNGVKFYCPDILGGPVYTPDEFDMPVGEDGTVIEGVAIEVDNAPATTTPDSAMFKSEDQRPANGKPAYSENDALAALKAHYGDKFADKAIRNGLRKLDHTGKATADMVDAFKAAVSKAEAEALAASVGGELAPKESA